MQVSYYDPSAQYKKGWGSFQRKRRLTLCYNCRRPRHLAKEFLGRRPSCLCCQAMCWGPIIIGESILRLLIWHLSRWQSMAQVIPLSSLHSCRSIPYHPITSFIHAAPSLPCPVAPSTTFPAFHPCMNRLRINKRISNKVSLG